MPLAIQAMILAIIVVTAVGHPASLADAPPSRSHQKTLPASKLTLNVKADGYRGIWYMNEPVKSDYRYKYSGGLGTYCDYHSPFAIYRPQVNKTFFCYGGARPDDNRQLLHMVSYYDHRSGTVPRPTILLDKHTNDAHDNPVMAIDNDGYIWIFSTAHGLSRPAYIHRGKQPYCVDEFESVPATRLANARPAPLDNFSYFQVFYDANDGFRAFFTRYNYPADRTACFMTSADGRHWSEWKRLASIERGHYQIGATRDGKLATMFNIHPNPAGLNARTNLYYLESTDNGNTWHAAGGEPVQIPLTTVHNAALVHDYQAQQLLVYVKDLEFDPSGMPVLVYSIGRGFEPGPQNGDRALMLACWTGKQWDFHEVTKTDHNYDSATISFDADGTWRIIAPTDPGPQPYGTGGEMVLWTSSDRGAHWNVAHRLTSGSQRNHSYARRPLDAHPDFVALWADGNAREPSESRLYFCNQQGDVFELPANVEGDTDRPRLIRPRQAAAAD